MGAQNAAADQLVSLTRACRSAGQNMQSDSAERLVWLSLGSMTNIADALRVLLADPLSQRVLPDEIIVLGTRLDGGWDLNVRSDLRAAEYVLTEASKFANITVIPMESVAPAVVGMRHLDQLRKDCKNGWIAQHVGTLKRFAWLAGHLQRGVAQTSGMTSRSAHGFRPWDVAAATAVAYPGQLFSRTSCRIAARKGWRVVIGSEEVPCQAEGKPVVHALMDIAVPQFLAVMVDGLCYDPQSSRQEEAPTSVSIESASQTSSPGMAASPSTEEL